MWPTLHFHWTEPYLGGMKEKRQKENKALKNKKKFCIQNLMSKWNKEKAISV